MLKKLIFVFIIIAILCGGLYMYITTSNLPEAIESAEIHQSSESQPLITAQPVVKTQSESLVNEQKNSIDEPVTRAEEHLQVKNESEASDFFNPAFTSEKSLEEYFNDDTRNSEWAYRSEAELFKVLESQSFKENYPIHTSFNLSCKDTMCRVSLNKNKISYDLVESFAHPFDSNEQKKAVMKFDDSGNTFIYIYRSM